MTIIICYNRRGYIRCFIEKTLSGKEAIMGKTAHLPILARKRFYLLLVLLFLTERTGYANSQEMIFFPVGQMSALILAIAVSIILIRRWLGGVIAMVLTLAVCVVAWFIPGCYFPESLRGSETGYFFEGFVPPTVVTFCAALLGGRKRSR